MASTLSRRRPAWGPWAWLLSASSLLLACQPSSASSSSSSAATAEAWSSIVEEHTRELFASVPAAGRRRHPRFIHQAVALCEHHHPLNTTATMTAAAIGIARRECFRAAVSFCRAHQRLDSYCLFVLHQHYHAANAILAFDRKISLRTGVPPMSVVVPYDGAEVWDTDWVPYSIRTVHDPWRRRPRGGRQHWEEAQVTPQGDHDEQEEEEECWLDINQGRLRLERKKEGTGGAGEGGTQGAGGAGEGEEEAPGAAWKGGEPILSEFLVHARMEGPGPWTVAGHCTTHQGSNTTYVAPTITLSKLRPKTCKTRPDWESIRVWDVFLFNGEADLLEVRLHELAPVVHKFIIIEFDTTYRGGRKQYQFERLLNGPQRRRFSRFLDRIVYIKSTLPLPSSHHPHNSSHHDHHHKDKYDAWSIEYLQRDAIADGLSVAGARLGDLVLLLDADELVRRDVVHTITKCTAVQLPADLRMDHYMYYNFHWKKRGLSFHGIASFVSLLLLHSPSEVRLTVEGRDDSKAKARDSLQLSPYYVVPDVGWHLSYFMTPEKVSEKLGQFAHSELDLRHFNTTDKIRHRMHKGLDLFDRPERLDFLPAERLLATTTTTTPAAAADTMGGSAGGGDLLPAYVRDNLYKFRHLLPHIPEDIIMTQQQQKQQQQEQSRRQRKNNTTISSSHSGPGPASGQRQEDGGIIYDDGDQEEWEEEVREVEVMSLGGAAAAREESPYDQQLVASAMMRDRTLKAWTALQQQQQRQQQQQGRGQRNESRPHGGGDVVVGGDGGGGRDDVEERPAGPSVTVVVPATPVLHPRLATAPPAPPAPAV